MSIDTKLVHKMWMSSSSEVRKQSLVIVYEDDTTREQLFNYFLARTESIQEAEEMLQQTLYKMLEQLNDRRMDVTYPIAYIWEIANNLVNDWYRTREGSREIPLNDIPSHQKHLFQVKAFEEEDIDKKWVMQDAVKLIPHLKKEEHRWMGTLFYRLGLTGRRVHLLTGQNIKTIRYVDKQIKKQLRTMWLHERKILRTELDPWSKQLSFTGDNSPVCVGRMNISPIIHRDSMKKLYKDFQANSYEQFRENIACMLRCEVGFSPGLVLTFVPRQYFSKEVLLEEKRLNYMACVPVFERENGRLVLTLGKKIEFSGRIVGGIQSDERGVWTEIIYEFPEIGLKARKAFGEKFLYHYLNPAGRVEPITYLYRLYPIHQSP